MLRDRQGVPGVSVPHLVPSVLVFLHGPCDPELQSAQGFSLSQRDWKGLGWERPSPYPAGPPVLAPVLFPSTSGRMRPKLCS